MGLFNSHKTTLVITMFLLLNNFVGADEDNSFSYFESGIRYFNRSNYKDASAFFREALNINNKPYYRTYLAATSFYLNKEKEAEEQLLIANNQSPGIVAKVECEIQDKEFSNFWEVVKRRNKGTIQDPIKVELCSLVNHGNLSSS